MELPAYLALLKKLQETQSPIQKKLLLTEFFVEQEINMKLPEVKEVLDFYQVSIDIKKKQGSKGGTITSNSHSNIKKSVKKSLFTKPMFVEDYKHGALCNSCHKAINSKIAFRWKQPNGEYHDYHALPECFPADNKHEFEINSKYSAYMMPKINGVANEKE